MSENEISDLIVKAYSNQKDGQLSLAIQSWNELLNHPSVTQELSANAQLNLGNLHLQQGNSDLAYESMAKAIKANPNSFSHTLIGKITVALLKVQITKIELRIGG